MSMVHNRRMPINVFADSDTDRAIPLRAARLAEHSWNGFPVPLVTGADFGAWLQAMARNDSAWQESRISITSYGIFYFDENGSDEFDAVDELDGVELYALSGWTWAL